MPGSTISYPGRVTCFSHRTSAGSCSVPVLLTCCSACNAVHPPFCRLPCSALAQPSLVDSRQEAPNPPIDRQEPRSKPKERERHSAFLKTRLTPPPLASLHQRERKETPLASSRRARAPSQSVPFQEGVRHPHIAGNPAKGSHPIPSQPIHPPPRAANRHPTRPNPSACCHPRADTSFARDRATACDRPYPAWCAVLVPGWRSKISARRQTIPAPVARVSLDSFASNP